MCLSPHQLKDAEKEASEQRSALQQAQSAYKRDVGAARAKMAEAEERLKRTQEDIATLQAQQDAKLAELQAEIKKVCGFTIGLGMDD